MSIIQCIISVALLTWLASRFDHGTLVTLASIPLWATAVAIGLFVLSQVWCATRLRVLLGNNIVHGAGFGLGFLVRLTLAGFFLNNFLPSSVGGDVAKGVILVRKGLPPGRAASSLVVDRLVNLFAVVFLTVGSAAFASLPWPTLTVNCPPLWVIAIAGLAVVAVLPLARLTLGFRFARHLATIRMEMTSWLRVPSRLGMASLLSLGSLGSAIGAEWVFARNLGLPLGLGDLTLVICIITLMTLVPVSLNGVGLQEASFVYFLSLYGADPAVAFTFALLCRLLILMTGAVGGLIVAFDPSLLRLRSAGRES